MAMTPEQILTNAQAFAERLFQNDFSGHDFQHTLRVFRNATAIAQRENADLFLVQLAALLHDVDDRKLFGNSGEDLPNARRFMRENGCDESTIERICLMISEVSFKGTGTKTPSTLEGQVVQDADRLDAIGAIGIARAFAFGGSRGRAIYLPEEAAKENMTAEEYAANQGTSVNHFYEKLLKLRDLMNTPTARQLATGRHQFMESFLAEFFAEWNGER